VRRTLEAGRLEELGLGGLVIPEKYGGAGLGWVELAAVMEELGRALAPSPLLATSIAVAALLDAHLENEILLGAIARGEVTATLVTGAITARRAPDQHTLLSGRARQVLDGARAELLIVAAGEELYEVPAGAAGLRRHALPTMDDTRELAEITLDAVRIPDSAHLAGATASKALQLGRIALAAEQLGGADRCLEMSVEYAKVRHQFGRPIGSFQAIQHRLADMFVLVESARSAAYYAAWAAAHAPDELAEASACAAAFCGDAFFQVAGDTIQVHGGIGFTWEHEAHRYFKRARAARTLFGTPTERREEIAQRILD
jgi:alkylation response protein AidB-like acyl-CoA dehydrogenase